MDTAGHIAKLHPRCGPALAAQPGQVQPARVSSRAADSSKAQPTRARSEVQPSTVEARAVGRLTPLDLARDLTERHCRELRLLLRCCSAVRSGPCRRVLTSAFACPPVRIMIPRWPTRVVHSGRAGGSSPPRRSGRAVRSRGISVIFDPRRHGEGLQSDPPSRRSRTSFWLSSRSSSL